MRAGIVFVLTLFVAAALIVAVTVPTLYVAASSAARRSRAAVADACMTELAATLAGGQGTLEQTLLRLQQRYGLEAVRVVTPQEAAARRSDPLREFRTLGPRPGKTMVEFKFPPDPTAAVRHPLRLAAAACIVAAITALVLLLSAVVASPAKQATDSDTSYLFQTFETSIRTMKGRESELKRLRDQEKERADELAAITGTLVRSLTSGFLSIDERGALVDMNQQARELLRAGDDNFSGRTILQILGPTPFARTVQNAVDGRLSLQREEVGEGDHSLIGVTTVPLLDERGRYLGMLALFTDLMPVRRLEGRVREMQSLADLGEMSAGIAHEFRNSLSTVLGYLSLARKSALPSEADERLVRAETEARQLGAAVESLLAFARPMNLNTQEIDLRELVVDIVEQMRPMATGVRFDIEGEPAVVDGDPVLLRRVLENVLRNAVEAIREKGTGGTVTVRATTLPSPTLTVEDDGAGIDPARVATLFLPFQSSKRNGFGLGLALARKIVLLHGGTISLTGQPQRGATVQMVFPTASPSRTT